MKMTRDEFLRWKHKAVTLLGMSGVGKTTLANKLPKTDWFHYSGDYRIGTKYLAEPITDNVKRAAMQVPFLRGLLCSDSIYIRQQHHRPQPGAAVDLSRQGGRSVQRAGSRARSSLPASGSTTRPRVTRDARRRRAFVEKAREIYGYDALSSMTPAAVSASSTTPRRSSCSPRIR